MGRGGRRGHGSCGIVGQTSPLCSDSRPRWPGQHGRRTWTRRTVRVVTTVGTLLQRAGPSWWRSVVLESHPATGHDAEACGYSRSTWDLSLIRRRFHHLLKLDRKIPCRRQRDLNRPSVAYVVPRFKTSVFTRSEDPRIRATERRRFSSTHLGRTHERPLGCTSTTMLADRYFQELSIGHWFSEQIPLSTIAPAVFENRSLSYRLDTLGDDFKTEAFSHRQKRL